MEEIAIPVRMGGLVFKNPFYVASGPAVRTVRQLKKIEETGWAAASIKLSVDPAPYINNKPRYGYFREYRALGFTAEKRLTFEEGLQLVGDAKKELKDLLIFANITYAGSPSDDYETAINGWVNMARRFESCGADVIELNMCCPNMSYNVEVTSGGQDENNRQESADTVRTGASMGQQPETVAEILRRIKKAVRIPVFVKLTPEGGQIAQTAAVLFDAGADAVGGTGNRLGMPPIDIDRSWQSPYELQKEISMSCLSGPWLKPLALRDTYEIRQHCGPKPFIMATGGISGWKDSAEMILCGANLIGICTAVMLNGYDIVRPMIRGLKDWMDCQGYSSLDDFRGKLVNEIKTAGELTVYDGYAEITKEGCAKNCGLCQRICNSFAPEYTGADTIKINRELCTGCGICAARCPNKFISMITSE
ncbi:MAG: 4Fe-4S binding protein [Treponema sp.]|nr:4Fe-4S binding protein [Treponema sp.]